MNMISTDFDLGAAAARYRQSCSPIDHFCIDEMVGYFVSGWNQENGLKDTPENRNKFQTALRNRLLQLETKDYVKKEY